MNWKLPNKELPINDEFYLITCFDQSSKQNKTFVAVWSVDQFYLPNWNLAHSSFSLWTISSVIAWSELPEPFNK